MKKLLLLSLTVLSTVSFVFSQINYSENWDAATNLNGWTSSSGNWELTSITPCQGNSVRRNIFNIGSQGDFISPNIGVSAGGVVTLNYDYKVIDWSGGAPTPATFGSIIVSYSNNASGPWQV